MDVESSRKQSVNYRNNGTKYDNLHMIFIAVFTQYTSIKCFWLRFRVEVLQNCTCSVSIMDQIVICINFFLDLLCDSKILNLWPLIY